MKNLIFLLLISIIISSCSPDNDSSIQNTASLDFIEVMSFQVDTLALDMTSNINANSYYITYSGDSGLNENVLKYNLTSMAQTDLVHPDISESRQIEVINGNIYSISHNDVYRYDLNLNNLEEVNIGYSDWRDARATIYNNNILMTTFLYDGIRRFDTSTNDYVNPISSLPNQQGRLYWSDGEVYGNKLYVFGGGETIRQPWPNPDIVNSFSEITIYDFNTDSWSEENLPYVAYETFTALYNSSIIVTGNRNQDQTNSFIGQYDILTNTYSELDTSLDLENITIRGITILNDEILLAYIDLVSPMPDLMTVKVVKASLL